MTFGKFPQRQANYPNRGLIRIVQGHTVRTSSVTGCLPQRGEQRSRRRTPWSSKGRAPGEVRRRPIVGLRSFGGLVAEGAPLLLHGDARGGPLTGGPVGVMSDCGTSSKALGDKGRQASHMPRRAPMARQIPHRAAWRLMEATFVARVTRKTCTSELFPRPSGMPPHVLVPLAEPRATCACFLDDHTPSNSWCHRRIMTSACL